MFTVYSSLLNQYTVINCLNKLYDYVLCKNGIFTQIQYYDAWNTQNQNQLQQFYQTLHSAHYFNILMPTAWFNL